MENLAKGALVAFAVFGVPFLTKSHLEAWQIAVLVAVIVGVGLYLLQRFLAG